MSARDWPDRIRDILEAIAEIQAFTDGMDLATFESDPKTVKAVELDLIIIGEAARAIPDVVQQQRPDVPWQLMRAMRNRMVHVYFHIDPVILWKTIQDDLPTLVSPLTDLLTASDLQTGAPDSPEG